MITRQTPNLITLLPHYIRDGSQLVYTFNIGIGIAIGIDAYDAFSIPIPIAIPTILKWDMPCKLMFSVSKV
jgi:hypothetical protein